MLKKLLSLLVLIPGCISGKTDVKSDWQVLDKAESVKCAEWPHREKDLNINDIGFFPLEGAFLVQGISRNTSAFAYKKKFDGDYEVDIDDVGNFQIGRAASVAGLSRNGNQQQFVVFEEKQGKTLIEFRNAATNVVDVSFSISETDLKPTGVFQGAAGVWISYKNDDQTVRFMFVDPRKGKDAKPAISALKFVDQPKVSILGRNSSLVLVNISDRQKTKLEVSTIDISGQSVGPVVLAGKAANQIESFTSEVVGNDLYISFVDGDSLVGESMLKLLKISLAGKAPVIRWTKVESLKNLHVNEPVFVSTKKGLELLVLKWVDEESTIARYMVTPDGFGKPKYAGVFKRGSRIMDAFSSESGRTFAITRSKGSDRWEFLLCRL